MGIELSADSARVLVAFGCYLVGVAALGVFAHRYLSRGSFVKEYFLGNRGLGPWVLALTVAATAISGGTFMGFPSLIYSKGWVMALWIASYMVVPLTTMALMGKRINQVARLAGSVTVPDVLRDRFASPALGVVSTLLILVMLTFNLVAQFKAGALVMQEALDLPRARGELRGVAVREKDQTLEARFRLSGAAKDSEPERVPLPEEKATYTSCKPEVLPPAPAPPDHAVVHLFTGPKRVTTALQGARAVALTAAAAGPAQAAASLPLAEAGPRTVAKRVNFPEQKLHLPVVGEVGKGYLLGLLVFALTVVAYTTYGGFWAVTWTDVLEGLVMLVGVVVMAVLAVQAVKPVTVERPAPPRPGEPAPAVVKEELHGLAAATETLRREDARLVYGPGPASTPG